MKQLEIQPMNPAMRLLLPILFVPLLSACASDVPRRPAALTPLATSTQPAQSFTLTQRVALTSAAGYYSEMRAGSRWVSIGRIGEGEVFRPENSVFQVEGRHVHEAYVVIHDGKVVGFYLPVEKSFSPLAEAVPLSAKM